MPSKSKDETLPLVVCDEGGAFLFLASTNKKGYTKSIEQGALWAVHPDTDRLLPSGKEGRLITIEDREKYYYAEVSVSSNPAPSSGKPAGESPADHKKSDETQNEPPETLLALADLIHRRRQELPEGSYTTHLFKSGAEKIRKKTGEEAIELILAKKKDEIIWEAADLVYHLLVMLEAEGIGIGPVLEELARRGK